LERARICGWGGGGGRCGGGVEFRAPRRRTLAGHPLLTAGAHACSKKNIYLIQSRLTFFMARGSIVPHTASGGGVNAGVVPDGVVFIRGSTLECSKSTRSVFLTPFPAITPAFTRVENYSPPSIIYIFGIFSGDIMAPSSFLQAPPILIKQTSNQQKSNYKDPLLRCLLPVPIKAMAVRQTSRAILARRATIIRRAQVAPAIWSVHANVRRSLQSAQTHLSVDQSRLGRSFRDDGISIPVESIVRHPRSAQFVGVSG